MSIGTALILAGGFGTRLVETIGGSIPKPMAMVNQKPFLEYLLLYLKSQGIENVIILCHYKHEKIVDHFNEGDKFGLKIKYIIEDEPLGTGGALINAARIIKDKFFFVFNGDSIFITSLSPLLKLHNTMNGICTMALKELDDTGRYGRVTLDGNRIIGYQEKKIFEKGLINSGVYIINKQLFVDMHFPQTCSFEDVILPKLLEDNFLYGQIMSGNFIDIGIPESYQKSQSLLQGWLAKNTGY